MNCIDKAASITGVHGCIFTSRVFLLCLLMALAAPASADVVVIDFFGRAVHLEAPAERIVALAPHVVENLYTAGVGDRLVGAVAYSDYPEAAKKLPRVGTNTSTLR